MTELRFLSGGDELWAAVTGSARSSAPTVILLHPTPLDHRFWLPVVEHLAPRYRYVLADLRGHGRSPLGQRSILTVDQLGRDALALADALRCPQPIWIGCSLGGYTLYELWRRAPERVRALAFCCSKPHPDAAGDREMRQRWITLMEARAAQGEAGPGATFSDAMMETLTAEATRSGQAERLPVLRAILAERTPAAIAAIQRGLGARPDSRPTAATITVPTCVLAGREDHSSTPASMDELAALLGAGGSRTYGGSPGRAHVLEQAGHYAPWEQPGAAAELLQAFLASL